MSQISRINNGIIPPGAGILKLETDDNFQEVPDINGVVFLHGGANIVTFRDPTPQVNTAIVSVTDSIYLPATVGPDGAGSSGIYGIENTRVLHTMGGLANENIFVGFNSGNLIAGPGGLTGTNNTIIGTNSGAALTSGSNNSVLGRNNLLNNTSGSGCVAIGSGCLFNNVDGVRNLAIGTNAGAANDANAHDNINIGNAGGAGINNRTTIGTIFGGGAGQSECFIHGIRGVGVVGYQQVVIDANGQLGSAAIPVTGVQSFAIPAGDPVFPTGAGLITLSNGANITITSPAANQIQVGVTSRIDLPATNAFGTIGVYAIDGFPVLHTRGGAANNNLGVGTDALNLNVTGTSNTALGSLSLFSNTTGNLNCAAGANSMLNNTTGNFNTACGAESLQNNVSGRNNISIGWNSGINADANANYNIWIGNDGVAGCSNRISIGDLARHTTPALGACYIQGIWQKAVAIGYQQVVVDATGKLGSTAIVPLAATFRGDGPTTTTPTDTGIITFNSSDGNLSTLAAANAVSYRLANDINVVRDVIAGRFMTATGDIQSTTGSVYAATTVTGNTGVTAANNNVTAATGDVIANRTLFALNNGIDSTGAAFFRDASLPVGTAYIDPLHQLRSSNGNDGQVLIAATAHDVPQWANITSGDGSINIANGAHTIDIRTAGVAAARPCWSANLAAATGFIFGNLPIQFIGSGNPGVGIGPVATAFSQQCVIANGAPGTPTRFTAITTGLYNFTLNIGFYTSALVDTRQITLIMQHDPGIRTYGFYDTIDLTAAYRQNREFSQSIYLTAGQSVTFGVFLQAKVAPALITGLTTSTSISGFLVS